MGSNIQALVCGSVRVACVTEVACLELPTGRRLSFPRTGCGCKIWDANVTARTRLDILEHAGTLSSVPRRLSWPNLRLASALRPDRRMTTWLGGGWTFEGQDLGREEGSYGHSGVPYLL